MIRASNPVEEDIPFDPSLTPRREVRQNGMGVPFGAGPCHVRIASGVTGGGTVTGFGTEENVLFLFLLRRCIILWLIHECS